LLAIAPMHAPPPTPRDVAAPPRDAQRTARGVAYRVLRRGTGAVRPTPADTVTVHYSGWTADGQLFDSSVVTQAPMTTPLGQMLTGWIDGLSTMVVGETTRFWIPAELAYRNEPGRPAGTVVFDIELLAIAPTATPAHP